MSAALISVIIPVYQAEMHLRRGLDSLLQQSDGRWEALCINDGSTDNSAAILEEYAQRDPRFRVFHQENSGVSAARNFGIEKAGGSFITFLDADDWFSPELIANIQQHLHREQVDIILFNAQVEYTDGLPRVSRLEENLHLKHQGEYPVTPQCVSFSIGTCWAKAYRKTFLNEKELRFPLNMRQEDEVFYRCSMAVARHIFCSDYYGYHYLQTTDSYMHTTARPYTSYLLYLKGLALVHDYYREKGCLPVWEETLLTFLVAQMAEKQKEVTRSELRAMRENTSAFLSETDIPSHFRRDYRLRYISACSVFRDFFIHRMRDGEVYGLGDIGIIKIRYIEGRFERCITPISKLKDLFIKNCS